VFGRGNSDLARAVEETQEFNREILLRNEKVYTGVIVRLEELGEETRANTEQTRSNTEETKAQTQALLKLIDRLDEKT
jgi:uncharacterized protein with HEPN domain